MAGIYMPLQVLARLLLAQSPALLALTTKPVLLMRQARQHFLLLAQQITRQALHQLRLTLAQQADLRRLLELALSQLQLTALRLHYLPALLRLVLRLAFQVLELGRQLQLVTLTLGGGRMVLLRRFLELLLQVTLRFRGTQDTR